MSRSHVTTRGSLDSAGRETRCLAERPAAYPTATRPAGDGAVADPAVVAEAWDNWRGQVAFAEQFVAAQQDLGAMASFDNGLGEQDSISVREALVHMIEEYARHMGHADFLRERIDGRVGQ